VVVCQLETPLDTVGWALEAARRQRATTILNPAPVPEAPLACWSLVDYLTPNEGEAARLSGVAITGAADVPRAAEALRARGVGVVVVTCGADGVLACTADGAERVPAHAVTVVDTTAAGDAFTGALAVALAEARPLREALSFATAAAALACTRRGAQASLPTRSEVDKLLGG
jgi:ribokinase